MGVNKANALRLRALQIRSGPEKGRTALTGFVGGEKVVEGIDALPGDLSGEASAVAVGAAKNGNGVIASVDDAGRPRAGSLLVRPFHRADSRSSGPSRGSAFPPYPWIRNHGISRCIEVPVAALIRRARSFAGPRLALRLRLWVRLRRRRREGDLFADGLGDQAGVGPGAAGSGGCRPRTGFRRLFGRGPVDYGRVGPVRGGFGERLVGLVQPGDRGVVVDQEELADVRRRLLDPSMSSP